MATLSIQKSFLTQSEEAREFAEFLSREGIRNDFVIGKGRHGESCLVSGRVIKMWPGLKGVDKDAFDFLLLRQFYYLKTINLKIVALTQSVFVFAICILLSRYLNADKVVMYSFCFTFITYLGTLVYLKRSYANSADDFAIKNASLKQLEGGIRYLTAIKEIRELYVKKLKTGKKPESLERVVDGNVFLVHASISVRVAKIQKAIRSRCDSAQILRTNELSDAVRRLANLIQREMVGADPKIYLLLC